MELKLNANAHAILKIDMSVKPKGYIDLIHGDMGANYALMKADGWALAILIEGLKNSVQKYEQLTDPGDKDKLEKIKEIRDSVVYIRQSCISQ